MKTPSEIAKQNLAAVQAQQAELASLPEKIKAAKAELKAAKKAAAEAKTALKATGRENYDLVRGFVKTVVDINMQDTVIIREDHSPKCFDSRFIGQNWKEYRCKNYQQLATFNISISELAQGLLDTSKKLSWELDSWNYFSFYRNDEARGLSREERNKRSVEFSLGNSSGSVCEYYGFVLFTSEEYHMWHLAAAQEITKCNIDALAETFHKKLEALVRPCFEELEGNPNLPSTKMALATIYAKYYANDMSFATAESRATILEAHLKEMPFVKACDAAQEKVTAAENKITQLNAKRTELQGADLPAQLKTAKAAVQQAEKAREELAARLRGDTVVNGGEGKGNRGKRELAGAGK